MKWFKLSNHFELINFSVQTYFIISMQYNVLSLFIDLIFKVNSNINNNGNNGNAESNSNCNLNSNLNSNHNKSISNNNSISNCQVNDLDLCASHPIKIPSNLTLFPPFNSEGDIIVWLDKIERLNKVLRLNDESLIETICMQLDPKTLVKLK